MDKKGVKRPRETDANDNDEDTQHDQIPSKCIRNQNEASSSPDSPSASNSTSGSVPPPRRPNSSTSIAATASSNVPEPDRSPQRVCSSSTEIHMNGHLPSNSTPSISRLVEYDDDDDNEEEVDQESGPGDSSGSGNEEDDDDDDEDDDYKPSAADEVELSEEDDDDGHNDDDSTSNNQKNNLGPEEMKKKMDDLWNQFQTDVKYESKSKIPTVSARTKTKTVTKHYDFAGESIQITETIAIPYSPNKNGINGRESPCPSSSSVTSSNSDQQDSSSGSRGPSKRNGIAFLSGDPSKIGLTNGKRGLAGLSSVLGVLLANKKQKIGTIEKTKLDWQQFKKTEGIEEELKVQLRSKDGYLDKQEFLQRTDYRQFEIERDMRSKRRRLK